MLQMHAQSPRRQLKGIASRRRHGIDRNPLTGQIFQVGGIELHRPNIMRAVGIVGALTVAPSFLLGNGQHNG